MSFNGGASSKSFISAATNNATVLATTGANVYSIQCGNIATDARYLKLYNKGTTPVAASDTPILVVLIPGNATGAGNNISIPEQGIKFPNGLSFTIVAGIANTDTTSVGANEVVVNIQF